MLEFGVEVSTGELVALERALRELGADAARSAVAKAHRVPVALIPAERKAVLSALRIVLEEAPGAADADQKGLAKLNARLQHEQESEVDAPPPPTRPRSTRK
jgi:hypothetical protein